MNIRDKLKLYETTASAQSTPQPATMPESLARAGGEVVTANGETLWRFTERVPLDAIVPASADDGTVCPLRPYLRYNRHPDDLSLDTLVFLDLETTSLSIGTGNYPFVIGLGFVDGGSFVVEQYLLHDYRAESFILAHIVPRLRSARALVTFNGKSFDVPLLKNRYRLTRVPGYPVDTPVIDLLFPCRRIFKSIYASCSLKSMEEKFLGIVRNDDIPGWMIPDVFFEFQRTGAIDCIPAVLLHNAIDVRSMASLLFALNDIYRGVADKNFTALETRALMNIAHGLYRVDRALFIDLVEFIGREVFGDRRLFKKYGAALKRTGQHDRAIELWREERSLYSLEELAKHFEHRARDYGHALAQCREAAVLIDAGVLRVGGDPAPAGIITWYAERFAKREKRLHRKAGDAEAT
ncbi:MAG TPA: ribonuclease H-like domain-containing protein [Spirochaetota bacterium]|nr:ribonuclease H-like domain-containing protein [Spirochaetota bacterium]